MDKVVILARVSTQAQDYQRQVNSVANLICTILLEIASMERLTINERMRSGRNLL